MQAAARAAGLGEGYTGHSGRVGMAQDLVKSGVELPALMTAGRWKSSKMPARYTERQAADRGAVARYYQGRRGLEHIPLGRGKLHHRVSSRQCWPQTRRDFPHLYRFDCGILPPAPGR